MFDCISLWNIFRKFLENFPMHTAIYGAASQILCQWTSRFISVEHPTHVQLSTEVSRKKVITKQKREFRLTVFI